MLSQSAIEGFRQHTNRTIQRAQYRVRNVWFDSAIHRREQMQDGRIAVFFTILIDGSGVVEEVRLFDTNNEVWASKRENIIVSGAQQGVLYRFAFDFREV